MLKEICWYTYCRSGDETTGLGANELSHQLNYATPEMVSEDVCRSEITDQDMNEVILPH